MIRPFLAFALAGLLFVPAVAANDRYPHSTMLGKVVAQVDPTAALAGVEIFLSAGLDRQTGAQNGYAALLAEIVARTPVEAPGRIELREAVANLGGALSASVEPQDVRYYVEGRPRTLVAALALLARALAAPDFSNATLAAAKAALRSRIDDADQSPFLVVSSMLRSAYYPGSGAGFAPSGTQGVVANASGADLRTFWSATYRRGGAALAAAGRVDDAVAAAAQGVVDALPTGDVGTVRLIAKTLTDPPGRIVTHRQVGLPWVGIGFAAPPAGAKDFAAMLVVQAVIVSLGRDSAGITTQPSALRAINAVYQYDVRPANFIVYSNGDSLESSSGVREIFAVIDFLSKKPLDGSVIQRYRTLAVGQFVIDNMTLEDRAALVGAFVRQGLDPDYPNAVLAALDGVTPGEVQHTAKTYLQKYTVAIVMPRAERSGR